MRMKKVFSLALVLLILLIAFTGCNNKKSDSIGDNQVISEDSSNTNVTNEVTENEETEDAALDDAADNTENNNKNNNQSDTDTNQTVEKSNDNNSNSSGGSSNKAASTPSTSNNTSKTETTKKPQATVTPTVQKPQATVTPSGGNTQTATTESQMISEVLRLVNEQRAANGLSKVTYRSDLQKAADIRAGEIINVFSHTRPNGSDCFTVFSEIGVTSYKNLGENIASGYPTAKAVMDGWMNSEGHRANILNSDFKGMVVGLKKIDSNRYAWVQLFITQ